jgi:hypothetical protein
MPSPSSSPPSSCLFSCGQEGAGGTSGLISKDSDDCRDCQNICIAVNAFVRAFLKKCPPFFLKNGETKRRSKKEMVKRDGTTVLTGRDMNAL